MQASGWIRLLRLIPAVHHNNLLLTTGNGTEIAVKEILRAERDFLVLRGRLTGTTDGGGFFFLPYDQISYLGFQRPVDLGEIQGMFAAPAPVAPTIEAIAPPTPEVEAPVSTSPPSPPAVKSPPRGVAKIDLLERLRAQRSDPTATFQAGP
jgi:hypothetical protein